MAATVTRVAGPFSTGDRYKTVSNVALDNSYPAGGYPLTPAQLGFASTTDPEFTVECDNANGWTTTYDYTNQKLRLWTSTATTSVVVTAGTDVSAAATVRITASGKYRQ